jgi:cysteine desulfurase
MLLIHLDLQGICVSGGSACSSGSGGSHVIKALGKSETCNTIRFSFSKYNTKEEIDQVVEVLRSTLSTKEALAV